jgi:hypothetical protein
VLRASGLRVNPARAYLSDWRKRLDNPVGISAYAICNTRLLEMARRHGRVHLVALWDGRGGDGPGGTGDLVAKARMEDEPDIFSPRDLQG